MDEIDYRDLLKRYIALVVAEEGTDFLGHPDTPDDNFEVDEWRVLHELAAR